MTAALVRRSALAGRLHHPAARPAIPSRPVTAGAVAPARHHRRSAGWPSASSTSDEAFLRLLEERYAGFIDAADAPDYEFDVELDTARPTLRPTTTSACSGRGGSGCSSAATSAPSGTRRRGAGSIRQSANPYSIDAVLRIVHTLVLAGEGGFLRACGERGPRWQGVRVCRRFGRGQDDDLAPGPARCASPHRRDLLRAEGGRRLRRLRHAVRRRIGARRAKT